MIAGLLFSVAAQASDLWIEPWDETAVQRCGYLASHNWDGRIETGGAIVCASYIQEFFGRNISDAKLFCIAKTAIALPPLEGGESVGERFDAIAETLDCPA